MKRKKLLKAAVITLAVILLLALGIGVYLVYAVLTFHKEALAAQIARHPEEFSSYDGKYSIRTAIEEDKSVSVHYVNVLVFDESTEQEVFSMKREYRAFDFGWVIWERNSYNFWLKSGDLGIFYYEYQENGSWVKYALVRKDGKYQLQSHDSREKTMDIEYEDIIKRLPDGYAIE